MSSIEPTEFFHGVSSFDPLDRQERRRRQGLPTVSSCVGPVGLVLRRWRLWCAAAGRVAVVLEDPTAEQLFAAWSSSFADRDLLAGAQQRLAERLGRPVDDIERALPSKSPYELQLLFEQAGFSDTTSDRDLLCRRLLEQAARGEKTSSQVAPEWPTRRQDDPLERTVAGLAALLELTGAERAPCVLAIVSKPDKDVVTGGAVAAVDRAGRLLTTLATRVPRLTLGLAVAQDTWRRYLEQSAESFTKAVLRESVVPMAGWTGDEIRRRVEDRLGRGAAQLQPLFERLAEEGASEEWIEPLADALAGTDQTRASESPSAGVHQPHADSAAPAEPEEGDDSHSAHELFLYELLEHTPDLAGLFALNVDPGFAFGGRPAELDLACVDLRIAIEVDGYYHFTSPEHYRRDRRKDWELQRQGYVVLRFLADDVVADIQTVRETVRSAVRFRGEPMSMTGGPRP